MSIAGDPMEVIKETTDWHVHNHTYVLDCGRLVAFKSALTGEFKTFSKSLHFDKNHRSFVRVSGSELEDIVMAVN